MGINSEELRRAATAHFQGYPPARRIVGSQLIEAADEIEALRARVAELEGALKMARLNGAFDNHPDCEEIDKLIDRAALTPQGER